MLEEDVDDQGAPFGVGAAGFARGLAGDDGGAGVGGEELAQAFAAALPQGREGLIVNVVDQRVLKATPQFFSYAVSKAGLWTATQMLAQALAPRIRVNAIAPGPTLPSIHQSQADFEAEQGAVPLGHGATPEEIGQALAYLIDARSVTGQMIAVDGGQHPAWRTPDVIGP